MIGNAANTLWSTFVFQVYTTPLACRNVRCDSPNELTKSAEALEVTMWDMQAMVLLPSPGYLHLAPQGPQP